MSAFGSLYTVRSGLHAARRGLDIVGQNVAQANTAGYSRQEVSNVAAQPSHTNPSGGQGISEVNVLRHRDEFLDRQYRNRAAGLGYHQSHSQALVRAEEIMGSLAEGGIRTALDQFFASWQNLALQPADAAARVQVTTSAEEFLHTSRQAFAELSALRSDLDEALQNKIHEINTGAANIAELNRAIASGEMGRQSTNDLRDQRDRLIDSLSQLGGTTTVSQTDGSVTVYLGSLPLVDRYFAYPIDGVTALEADPDPDPAISGTRQFMTSLTWNDTTTPAVFSGGETAGLLQVRDRALPAMLKQLDNLVRAVAEEVNRIHTHGVPPADAVGFFTIEDPASWMAVRVNDALAVNPDLILAAQTLPAQAGDGERARQIGGLLEKAFLTGPPVGGRMVSPGEYVRAVAMDIGLQVQNAVRRHEAATLQADQAQQQREGSFGVSLDDEMTRMIQFQQAYGASARVMNAIDEMLDMLVNRIGLVGR